MAFRTALLIVTLVNKLPPDLDREKGDTLTIIRVSFATPLQKPHLSHRSCFYEIQSPFVTPKNSQLKKKGPENSPPSDSKQSPNPHHAHPSTPPSPLIPHSIHLRFRSSRDQTRNTREKKRRKLCQHPFKRQCLCDNVRWEMVAWKTL